ncbi:Polyisoprenoid-binding protein YceI [Amycolatopsis xylanica]|uniref:Polyisoprenoid-binding protein YceI n=1 Tax=Amycolatopsis xylanica TaxID=589385 RepID=A0A1H2SQY5_9PSEU|nr:YceI family protein [Amycolatopsis xylanica]SDW34036.1 Polyisoprenoid-binding protein YceI [Amycolatopsis xylanica]
MSAPTQIPGYVTGTWAIDTAHSDVAYSVKHLGIAKSRGNFTGFGGTVVTAENILDSHVTVEIDAASVASGNGQRDDHLKTGDFFDVANHPTITFRSTGIREDGGDYKIDGELTWRGATVPVTLDAEFNGISPNPSNNNVDTIGVSASATVNRRDFGVGPEGNAFLSEKVKIDIEIQAALQS